MNRRTLLSMGGAAAVGALLPASFATAAAPVSRGPFRFCLNTSTIMGQQPGLVRSIEIAANAGYDGVELWIRDVKEWLAKGGQVTTLANLLHTKKLRVENAISFTEWMVDNNNKRQQAMATLEEEMKLMAMLGCKRIAAPPAGLAPGTAVDIQTAGERYREILALGRKTGVMPLLEFWGASGTVYSFGQALAIAAAANDADARILPDVYHLHRGGSGFDCLGLVSGRVIDIIHMNDFPADKAVAEQTDADRVYPGDGAAPFKKILQYLQQMGGPKTLSLELFNKTYWNQDAQTVATTGIQKMKALVSALQQQ